MADLNIAGSDGIAEVTTTGGDLIATSSAKGIAGATITPGQALYADPTAGNVIKPASATDPFQSSSIVGIALVGASENQPVTYATGGDIALSTSGAGTTLTSGVVYVLSETSGGIAPITDTPDYVAVLGVGNGGAVSGSTDYLRLSIADAPVVQ